MTTYKLDELASAAAVASRTVRYYVQRGLLPPPEFRGKDTSYGPDHLLRLRAIKRLQEERLSLDEIQVRLASASQAELERVAAGDAPQAVSSPPGSLRSPGLAAAIDAAPPVDPPPARWDRWELAPGVELHVSAGADPDAQRIAREVRAHFRAGRA